MGALAIEVLLGFLTFTASLMAFGKLQEILPQRPITYRGQNFVNLGHPGRGGRPRRYSSSITPAAPPSSS